MPRLFTGLIALIAAFASHSGTALAASSYYFSSSGGSDSNPCTQATPCQSLSKASSLSLNPGDNVLFKTGDTWTGGLVLKHSGSSSGGRITVEPYGSGARPKITGGNNGDCIIVNANFYTITNIETDSCGYAGTDLTGTDLTVEQMYATGNSVGIQVDSGTSNVLVTSNQLVNNNILHVNNCQTGSSGAVGVLLNGSAVVTNNTIHGSYTPSCAYGWDGSGVEIYNASNTWVHDNLIYDNDNQIELGGNGSGNAIDYNVMYSDPGLADPRTSGIVLPGSTTGTRISHNSVDVTGSTSEGIVCFNGCAGNDTFTSNAIAATTTALYTDNGSISVTGNVFNGTIQGITAGGTNSTATIGWMSRPSNLHETAGSPTIDHATMTNFSTDFDGKPVPDVAGTPSDSGAYEYQGSPPTAVTGSTSGVGASSASVAGSVNPDGAATTYHFDYGTSAGYGSQAPAPPDPSAGSGTSSQAVSAALSGLSPSTTYHYRLVATNASGTTTGSDRTFTTTAPHGSWVGVYGGSGYALAAWNHGTDVVAMPTASVTLAHGSRYVWAASTSDVRALESAGGSARAAATYYDSSEIQVRLSFASAYTGNLELYALDWDSHGRQETITVGTQTASLSSDFSQGAWVSFPISVAAGNSLSIRVDRVAGANAVLGGIMLGGGGTPPTTSAASQGSWVGAYGGAGYDLAAWNGGSDVVKMSTASVTLAHGSRYVWASSTTDVRALQSASGSPRAAATYYDSSQIQVQLTFSAAFSGNLELYAVDWDSRGRQEKLTVGTQTATVSGDFSQGQWVSFPISAATTLTITVDRIAGANAVLSGIFLGGGGSPPQASTNAASSVAGTDRQGSTLSIGSNGRCRPGRHRSRCIAASGGRSRRAGPLRTRRGGSAVRGVAPGFPSARPRPLWRRGAA